MSHETSEVEVHIGNASTYGLSFNNSPTTKPSDMIFTGVDWDSGTLNADGLKGELDQDVLQDGNEYSVRSKFYPEWNVLTYALSCFAFGPQACNTVLIFGRVAH